MKHRYLLLLGFIFFHLVLLGQDLSKQDSLNAKEFDQFFNIITGKHISNFDSASFYIQRLEDHVNTNMPNCKDCYVQIEGLKAVILYYSDKLEQTIEQGEKAYDIAYEAENWIWCIQDLTYVGYAYRQLGEIAKAANTFSKSMELASEKGYSSGVKTSLRNISDLYLGQGELDKAILYANRTLDLLTKDNTP